MTRGWAVRAQPEPSVPDLSSLGWQPGEVEQQQIIPRFAFFMFLCKAFNSQLTSSENPNGKELRALKHLEILPDLCRFSETLYIYIFILISVVSELH